MTRNKKRLYVAVYPTGQGHVGTYHWVLLVGPTIENGPVRGRRYHVKNRAFSHDWEYEVRHLRDVRVTVNLFERVAVGKIVDEARLRTILENIPVEPQDWSVRVSGRKPGWTCRTWLAAALRAIRADGKAIGTNVLDDIEGRNGIIETTPTYV